MGLRVLMRTKKSVHAYKKVGYAYKKVGSCVQKSRFFVLDRRTLSLYDVRMKQITPTRKDIVYQASAIGQAIHTLPMNLRRLIAVAMARIKLDENMEVEFSLTDAINALDIGNTTSIRNSMMLCLENAGAQIVKIDTQEIDGKWTIYPWFSFIEYDVDGESIKFAFNPFLRPYLCDFTEKFSMFKITDFGQLTGEYSQKIFDLVMSFSGYDGKGGNKTGSWWFQKTPDEIRALLNVRADTYPKTNELRRRCVDYPVKQINESGIGLHIEMEYPKKGKSIKAFRFNCKIVKRDDLRTVNPATQAEDEDAKLIANNQELFDAIKKDLADQPDLINEPRFGSRALRIELEAIQELRKRLGKK